MTWALAASTAWWAALATTVSSGGWQTTPSSAVPATIASTPAAKPARATSLFGGEGFDTLDYTGSLFEGVSLVYDPTLAGGAGFTGGSDGNRGADTARGIEAIIGNRGNDNINASGTNAGWSTDSPPTVRRCWRLR